MEKKKIGIIVAIILIIFVGAGIGMSFLMKNDDNTTDEQQNSGIENSTNEEIETEEYGVFTDIDSISATKWEEKNSIGFFTNKVTFEMLYEDNIGITSGAIAIPRTNFYSYPTVGNENYKIEINTNKWFYLKNISEMKFEEGAQQDFYVLDTTFALKGLRLEVSSTNFESTNDYKNEELTIKVYNYNDWKFAGIEQEDGKIFFLGGYYSIESLYINYTSLSRLELNEEKFKEFCEELSKNVIIEKTVTPNSKKLELPVDYSVIKLSDEFSFNLGNVELYAWNSSESENFIKYNGIVFIDKNLGNGFAVFNEYEPGSTLEDVKTVLKYSDYSFETYNYKDMELELLFRDKKLYGVIFEINGNFYDLNGITGINNKDNLLNYVFENLIITND